MIIKAYAKINLVLDVIGTRPDGYHELATVMQSLALHDLLEVTADETIELEVEGVDLPNGPENLAYRAAEHLRRQTGYHGGARIRLRKNIPVAAGLAGGSADAAAVLSGLNQLWDLGLSMAELTALGAELGSDVPFCLIGGTALARGRGEIITPLPGLPAMGVVLIKPPFGVSTARVYQLYDQTAGPVARLRSEAMLEAVRRGETKVVASLLHNDLEPVTLSLHPVIGEIKKTLTARGALGVLMSGSGSTVFGLFSGYTEALAVSELIKVEYQDYWVAATEFFSGKVG